MTAHAREREQVGLQAGAAGRIGCGEGEHDRREAFRVSDGIEGVGVASYVADCYNSRHADPADSIERSSSRPSHPAMKKYMCLICGWIYDEAAGAPDEGIAPGTRWEDVPPNWTCPECGARKDDFEMVEF